MIERQKDADLKVVVVVTTFPDECVGRQIGTRMVGSQLIACINLLPGVSSIYQWKGKVETDSEVIGIMKTSEANLERLEAWLQENHPYAEPEFVVISVEAGSSGYLNWVREQTPVDKPSS